MDEGSQEISTEQWIAKGEVVERTGLDERTIERKVKDCVRIRPDRKQSPVVASPPVLSMPRPWRSGEFVSITGDSLRDTTGDGVGGAKEGFCRCLVPLITEQHIEQVPIPIVGRVSRTGEC